MLALMLEHDQALGNRIFDALRDLDISLHWVSDLTDARESLFREDFGVVLVDLGFLSGSTQRADCLCDLRRTSPASRFVAICAEPADLASLDGCAEAIVTTPVDIDFLVSNIRLASACGAGTPGRHATVVGDMYINFAFRVVEINGAEIELTRREFAILRILADQPGSTVGKFHLMESIYDTGKELESNSLEVHIHKLRGKIGRRRIRTIRGQGYRLDATA